MPGGNPRSQVEIDRNDGVIDVYYVILTSQGVQHRVFYQDGYPSRCQPRPTGLNFGEQTGTGVFPLVIAVPQVNRELKICDGHVNENVTSKYNFALS